MYLKDRKSASMEQQRQGWKDAELLEIAFQKDFFLTFLKAAVQAEPPPHDTSHL